MITGIIQMKISIIINAFIYINYDKSDIWDTFQHKRDPDLQNVYNLLLVHIMSIASDKHWYRLIKY